MAPRGQAGRGPIGTSTIGDTMGCIVVTRRLRGLPAPYGYMTSLC